MGVAKACKLLEIVMATPFAMMSNTQKLAAYNENNVTLVAQ